MASTVWKGHLTFGLVSVPVRLIRAARAERVKLRQLHRGPGLPLEERREIEPVPAAPPERQPDVSLRATQSIAVKSVHTPAPEPEEHLAPVRRVYRTPEEDSPAMPADLVKGYEYETGQYVVLEEQDLRALAPQTSTEIQIVEFVRFQEIDPVYLENSYYLIPDETAEKAYALLLEAMRETGRAAIGQLTMHRRDHVLIVRPGKRGLIAHTMFYPDEVRAGEEFRTTTGLIAAKELDLAKTLIEALAQPFDPARFRNAFRQRLNELIQSRIEGRETARTEPAAPAKVIDIMDALKRSLAQASTGKSPAAAESGPHKPAPAEQRPNKKSVRSEGPVKRANRHSR